MLPSDSHHRTDEYREKNLSHGAATPHFEPTEEQSPVPQGRGMNDNEYAYHEYSRPGQGIDSYHPVPSSPIEQESDSYSPLSQSSDARHPVSPAYTQVDAYTRGSLAPERDADKVAPEQGWRGEPAQWGNVPPGAPNTPNAPFNRPPSRGPRTAAIAALAAVILLVFGVGLFAGWQFGRDGVGTAVTYSPGQLQSSSNTRATIPALSGNNMQSIRESVISNVRPAVVQITVSTSKGTALGSGVIIDKRGYIVTNNHVVDGVQSIGEVALYDGTKIHNAQVVGNDPADDLAVIKINPPANIVTIPLADSSRVAVGQDVLAIGNPLGNTQTVTSGIISALGRNVSEQNGAIIPGAIQTDAPINPGNSGGALVDLQGNLVGIPTLTAIDPEFNAPANGVGFAIPSNRVKYIVPQIIQNGSVAHSGRSALGIKATAVDPTLQQQDSLAVDHGVMIAELVRGGAAEKAGMQVGDVIVQVNNTPIDNMSTLQDALLHKAVGDQVTVKAYRGNQQVTFNVKLGELQVHTN